MGMTDQVIREREEPLGGSLREIEAVLDRARDGEVGEDAALEAVARIARRELDLRGGVYQKPWG